MKIVFSNVTKKFKDITVLKNIDLTFNLTTPAIIYRKQKTISDSSK